MNAEPFDVDIELPDHAQGGYGLMGEQNANGVDLSLLRENLKLTPSHRLEKHYRAWQLMNEVRNAGIADGLRRPDSRA